ncbi:MAG: RodZ domain-containing protein [Terriglobales bacterium]
MPSFGEKLKLEREKRKITLEQISSSTKIGTRLLQALEDEKFNQLPGGIFNKGFVRAYARTLGLDEDQIIADYLEASGEAPPPRVDLPRENRDSAQQQNTHPHSARETENGRLEIRAEIASHQLPWGVFAVILLIIALCLSLWTHRRREQERLSHQTQTSQRLASPGSGQSAPGLNSPGSAPAASPVSESATNSPAALGSAPPASSPAVSTADKPAGASSSQQEPNTAPATPASGEFVLAIRARDESWLAVTVDDKPIAVQTLESGDERTFHGHQHIVIKAGNAGALDFRLNGKELPVGGDIGEVKTVTIGASGVLANASAPLSP